MRAARPALADADNEARAKHSQAAGNDQAFHAMEAAAVARQFATGPEGLTPAEAAQRLAQHGPNRLPRARKQGALVRFLQQFNNLLIYVLLAAAAISLALGHGVDTAVIIAVVVVNALIGFVQEGRAEQALEAISDMVAPSASVLRDGRRLTIPAEEVVPGDLVLIEAGDRVPADLRLIRVRSLRVDEAVLTGESVAAEKSEEPVAADAALGDRLSLAFSGTFVAAGQGAGIAVATGAGTELGHISALIRNVDQLKTPLVRQMDGFARQVTLAVLAASAATFCFAYFLRGYALADAFMTVVGLAVSAIPEGLPAIMTITLAIGVQRMAARNAIIRRLPAVETLGSVSVICSDKTGTLTRNEMTARAVVTASGSFEVSGTGYAPDGAVLPAQDGRDAARDPVVSELMRAACLCNDADIRETAAGWIVDGDPMEGALIAMGRKYGVDPVAGRRRFPRWTEIPFDAQHRFMATLHDGDGAPFIVVKGAPERILEMCSLERTADGDRPIDREAWRNRADALAARGQRVLGFATKLAGRGTAALDFADVDRDCVMLGIVGLIDPPREEAIVAVRDCHAAGIRVVMITGDHAVTAREIGHQLGLADNPRVMLGRDLDDLDDDALREAVRDTTIFARTTPEHKLRLVGALQANGLTVAMTGDGVNDAPALKRADVGVAMGLKGTEAAKEAAEAVIADDNFASIAAAVREGRTVYDNIIKVIGWTLPTNGGEALTILSALIIGLPLPVTPVQILWINMVTAVALGLTLAFEPTEPGTMRRPPRRADMPILTGELAWRIVFVSLLFVLGAFGIFFWAEARGLSIEEARTLVVNTLVVMEIFYLFSVRYVHGTSLTWRGVMGTRAVLIGVGLTVAAQLLFTYAPFMWVVFGTRPVTLTEGAAVIGIGIALLFVVEMEKRLRRGAA